MLGVGENDTDLGWLSLELGVVTQELIRLFYVLCLSVSTVFCFPFYWCSRCSLLGELRCPLGLKYDLHMINIHLHVWIMEINGVIYF